MSDLININEMIWRVPYNTKEIILADPKQYTNTWNNWSLSSNELCLNEIICTLDIETTYIDKWITSEVLKTELIAHLTYNKTSTSQTFTIYTDGSYNREDDNLHHDSALMGAGWIVKETNRTFKCGISKWPSSTRGELIAIFTALLTIPEQGQADIYTDSLAAIQSIKFFLNNTRSVRDVFKSTN